MDELLVQKATLLREITSLHRQNQTVLNSVGLSYRPGMPQKEIKPEKLVEGADGEPRFVSLLRLRLSRRNGPVDPDGDPRCFQKSGHGTHSSSER